MNFPERKHGEGLGGCAEVAALLVFYACDEVDEHERAVIESHLAACAQCRTQLQEEHDFRRVAGELPQASDQLDPTGILLTRLRSELAEALDDIRTPREKEKSPAFGWLRNWMALHPAWSGALLVLVGLLAGAESTQWFSGQNDAVALDQAVNVRPSRRLTEDQLSKMAVARVNFAPSDGSSAQNVRVQMSAEQPMELTGSLDDTEVQQVLAYVVKNGERFDSGIRLDCLDALKARAHDQEVRGALLCAARRDQNPAVRMKALEALRDSSADPEVREALLQALRHDANPGVRVEAVNLLVRALNEVQPHALMPAPGSPPMAPPGGSMENVIQALRELQHDDPNQYVRLRSAAALRQINDGNDQ